MRRRGFVLGALGLSLVPTRVRAHPYHTTSAVADVRGRTLEVTLTVTPEDLQEALRRRAGRPVDIDADPEVDALAHHYVATRFVVKHAKAPLTMQWIGCEVEAETARLYFEFPLPADLTAVTLRNGVFFELAPAQINRVLVRRGKKARTLRFRAEDAAEPLV